MFNSLLYAETIFPGDIVGRELHVPGLGWIGHVGIATRSMSSSDGMKRRGDSVIEVLNEYPVGQINSIDSFKSRSKYWGNKYLLGLRYNVEGYQALREANHQRWWCPKYTIYTDFKVGSGIAHTGTVKECGRWRCDTFVWWAFYSQGIDTMPGRAWMPKKLFNFFPYPLSSMKLS